MRHYVYHDKRLLIERKRDIQGGIAIIIVLFLLVVMLSLFSEIDAERVEEIFGFHWYKIGFFFMTIIVIFDLIRNIHKYRKEKRTPLMIQITEENRKFKGEKRKLANQMIRYLNKEFHEGEKMIDELQLEMEETFFIERFREIYGLDDKICRVLGYVSLEHYVEEKTNSKSKRIEKDPLVIRALFKTKIIDEFVIEKHLNGLDIDEIEYEIETKFKVDLTQFDSDQVGDTICTMIGYKNYQEYYNKEEKGGK